MKTTLQHKFYNYLFNRKIVYNVCMEDPRTDMLLFDPAPGSRLFVLASGGCNALHYALDPNFDSVQCVDANPCQVALVNLKKQVIENCDYEDLWKMFGDGVHENVGLHYEQRLRVGLPAACATYWDRNIKYFQANGMNNGFHYHTGCGFITHCFKLLKKDRLKQISALFTLADKKQQTALYEKHLEPVFNGLLTKLLINFTTRFGIPSRQLRMISEKPSEVLAFLNARIKKTLTELPANENYFYHVYIFGNYKRSCAPEYLKACNFESLKKAHRKVSVKNAYVTDYLGQTEQRFTHFALLDHLDWLVHEPRMLERQWRSLLSHAEVGAKVLVRSYFSGLEWLPDFAKKHLDFVDHIDEHVATDRLGIYNRTHLLSVKIPLTQ